ncbi:MAG TPA: prepilin-type N-terminal cleavage/methylation domain-containing protein [Patescibacteria group bacterium]|nr:prepilin-type N-terminal cleavage/methylation domain-containing protein [Patescibacteria group bacterium]
MGPVEKTVWLNRADQRYGNGFTLIEVVVVVGIISLMAAIAVPRFNHAMETARGAKIIADLRNIDSAVVAAQISNIAGPTLNSDATTGLIPRFLLAMPVPPAGVARFPQGGTLTVPTGPSYRIVDNRAVIGTSGNGNLGENLVAATGSQTY